jgi:hypothetical protein
MSQSPRKPAEKTPPSTNGKLPRPAASAAQPGGSGGRCRICGCEEYDACLDIHGRPCAWVQGSHRTRCTACLGLELPLARDKARWQEIADACAWALAQDVAQQYGICHGGPVIDPRRALRFLQLCELAGVRPRLFAFKGKPAGKR